MGLNAISQGDRLVALDAGEGTVLLLFRRGATTAGATFPGGRIPPHDGEGPAHFAFAVATEDLDLWRGQLAESGVLFRSALSQAPWTLPAMASVMTSLYPSKHGAIGADRKLGPKLVTLAEALREVGYHTVGLVSHTLSSYSFWSNFIRAILRRISRRVGGFS